MVGHVCSGKTTVLSNLPVLQDAFILSSNKFLFEMVDSGKYVSFAAAYRSRQSFSVRKFNYELEESIKGGVDVVIDRINTNKISRERLVSKFVGYEQICINVEAPFTICLRRYREQERLYRQSDQPNYYRSINIKILSEMATMLEVPSLREGYDCLINVNHVGEFKSVSGKITPLVESILAQLN